MKISLFKENLPVCVVIDYVDTQFSNFAILYLHMGPRLNLLKEQCHMIFDNFLFVLKTQPGPQMNGFTNFFIFAKIFVQNVCPCSP